MRKVKCKIINYEYNAGVRNKRETIVHGIFHQWGVDYEEYENGPGNYSVGIVELEDGSVQRFIPENITFID